MDGNEGALAHALELLEPLGPVTSKRMFGGHGIFLHERMFALIASEQLYLKVDDTTRPHFEEEGCAPFTYGRKTGQIRIPSYMTAPDDALESPEAMHPWAGLAIEAAMRAGKKGRKAANSKIKP
ncbi:MAG: TfoX/Sxy family protein [Geminicoccaceae bacterium]|nr:TfoX/Sxy family protein [Geminicoccaceae bacterium]